MSAGMVVDLLDPDHDALARHLPKPVHDAALARILTPAVEGRDPRPRLDSHGDYLFGVLVVPIPTGHDHEVSYEEIDVVVALDRLVVVRKTPPGGSPYDLGRVLEVCRRDGTTAGKALWVLFDDIAESYLDLIDDINTEIDELEDEVDAMLPRELSERLSTLRHDVIHLRRTLAPTRDAAHSILDGRLDIVGDDGTELFSREVELHFGDAYDKLLRAVDGLDLSRDLVAGVRDYHQAKVANDQNEVMKRLTIVSSLLLPPTFIVGLYGQNFVNLPELEWRLGYAFSWALIAGSTVGQLIYFRRRGWMGGEAADVSWRRRQLARRRRRR